MTLLNHIGILLIFAAVIYGVVLMSNDEEIQIDKETWYYPLIGAAIFWAGFETIYWIVQIFFFNCFGL